MLVAGGGGGGGGGGGASIQERLNPANISTSRVFTAVWGVPLGTIGAGKEQPGEREWVVGGGGGWRCKIRIADAKIKGETARERQGR